MIGNALPGAATVRLTVSCVGVVRVVPLESESPGLFERAVGPGLLGLSRLRVVGQIRPVGVSLGWWGGR